MFYRMFDEFGTIDILVNNMLFKTIGVDGLNIFYHEAFERNTNGVDFAAPIGAVAGSAKEEV
jgi:hypothetical protein